MYGEDNANNKMINIINKRNVCLYSRNQMNTVDQYDVFAKCENNNIKSFCNPNEKNAYYIYTEVLENYDIKKEIIILKFLLIKME